MVQNRDGIYRSQIGKWYPWTFERKEVLNFRWPLEVKGQHQTRIFHQNKKCELKNSEYRQPLFNRYETEKWHTWRVYIWLSFSETSACVFTRFWVKLGSISWGAILCLVGKDFERFSIWSWIMSRPGQRHTRTSTEQHPKTLLLLSRVKRSSMGSRLRQELRQENWNMYVFHSEAENMKKLENWSR